LAGVLLFYQLRRRRRRNVGAVGAAGCCGAQRRPTVKGARKSPWPIRPTGGKERVALRFCPTLIE